MRPPACPPRSLLPYARALFHGHAHPAYSPFAGPEQAAALEACLERHPDILFVHRLIGMGPLLRNRAPLPPILFDLDDVEHWVKIRGALAEKSWSGRSVRLLQAPAILAAERRAINSAARTFVCSEIDRDYLQRWGLGGIVAIPNAVLIPPEPQPVAAEKSVMLIGAYHYKPNLEAAERLINKIWPAVHARVPRARLIIAGSSPDMLPSFRVHPAGVELTGFVDDLEALYRRSRVVCSTLVNGGGTRIKLIEAAAYAKPIVSTAVGAEGLALRDGADILIHDDDRSLAESCVSLLENDAWCASLGRSAYQIARAAYDCDAVKKLIMAQTRSAADAENHVGVN